MVTGMYMKLTTRHSVLVRDELFFTGELTEDGEKLLGKRWIVLVKEPNGRTFANNHFFLLRNHFGGVLGFLDLNHVHEEHIERSESRAQKLVDRIVEAGCINMKHWHEIDPEYGSEYYISSGQDLINRDREIREDMEE